jgi:hypothetical protein
VAYVYVLGQGVFVSMFWGQSTYVFIILGGHSSYVILFRLECLCDFGREILYVD